jgi:hypothetical protein
MARITKEDESKQKVPFEKAISMTGNTSLSRVERTITV